MVKLLSDRVQKIAPSATFAVKAKEQALRAKGIDVISFGIGEPDFDTPTHIKDAAKKALDAGFTKYTASAGITELRQAIAEKMKKENNVECNAENVIVCNGAKHALANIFQAALDAGDEVIVLSPYWVSYLEQIKLADGIPKIVECNNEFQPVLEKIREAIIEKTKIILVNSPCNPTGAVFPKAVLKEVSGIALENDLYILSDECYEKFIYDDAKHYSIASFSNEIAERTITVNAFSKTYAMTGWRVGYAVGQAELIKAISSLQDQTTSNVNSIAQKAALAALQGSQQCVDEMVKAFNERRKYALKALRGINGVRCPNAIGAFYLFPYVNSFYNEKIKNSIAFSEFLLEKTHVAVVPGNAFGNDNCIRISYACSMDSLKEGMSRLKEALKGL